MIVTPDSTVAGHRVVKTLGLARGNTIRALHIGKDILALLKNVMGGEIEEYTELMDELVPRPKAGGLSAEKYQRHHDMHVLWHVKHAVEATERLWMRERCQRLLIGGTEEPLAELRRLLPKALHERLVGEIAVSVQDAADAILARTLEVERAIERRVEAERVAALLEAALGQGPGVLGLERTLEAVVEGRVHGAAVIARLEGIATREEAAGFRGAMVEVPREALPREGTGEVYLADLPGCRVVGANGLALGTVQAVDDYGAHPVLRVRDERGTERLIPLVPVYVKEVDLAARAIEVDWEADY